MKNILMLVGLGVVAYVVYNRISAMRLQGAGAQNAGAGRSDDNSISGKSNNMPNPKKEKGLSMEEINKMLEE